MALEFNVTGTQPAVAAGISNVEIVTTLAMEEDEKKIYTATWRIELNFALHPRRDFRFHER